MRGATIHLLISGFLLNLADAGEAPLKRGISTCQRAGDCTISSAPPQPFDPPAPTPSPAPTKAASVRKQRGAVGISPQAESGPGNLPGYLIGRPARMNEETEDVVIVPEKQTGALLTGLRAGDILVAEIEQSIKASPSVPTPIRARITQGRFRNTFVLGSATFDRELKRVLLVFDKLRLPGAEQSYQLKATGLALSGQVGLEGEHHTDEGVYFAAEVLTTTAAGYADATTSRNQNALGTYQTEPSLSNATKQGAVSALSKSAERFAERARSAPEYTEIEGGRAIQIIIETNPTEVSGS